MGAEITRERFEERDYAQFRGRLEECLSGLDGVTGANLLSQLCSVDRDPPPPEPVEGPGSAGPL